MAMTYEIMEGETRKKWGTSWQYGRMFRQWILTPTLPNFKSSGTTVNVWVPDMPRYYIH